MNLMFWKKKNGAEEEAENAPANPAVNAKPREALDFVAAKRDIAGRTPEPSEPESFDTDESSLESPAKRGLFARLKLQFGALVRHFKKPTAFRADEVQAPDTPGGTEEPEDAANMKPDPELEAPARPGLSVRIKLQIIALVRRFRKAPAPDGGEELANETNEPPETGSPAKPGIFLRIKAAFAAFIREFKAPALPAADEDEEAGLHGRSEAAPEGEHLVGEPAAKPARPRKWLVVGGSIAIVALLLIDIAMTLWLAYAPPQKRWGTRHDITSISSRPGQPEHAPDGSQAVAPEKSPVGIEALMKENAELQARIEALKSKKEPSQQRPDIPHARQTAEGAPPSFSSGDAVVSNKDPKATAMSLKEAIEAMNAGAGDYDKKPAK